MANRTGTLRTKLGAATIIAGLAAGAGAAQTGADAPSYFEFGKLVALGHGSVDVLTYDETRHKLVQHRFLLTRETRADKVETGDSVEIIYISSSGGPILRRLVVLTAGFPLAGPPSATATADARSQKLPGAPAAAPTSRSVTLPSAGAARPASGEVAVNLGRAAKPKTAEVRDAPLGAGTDATAKIMQPKVVARETPSEECNRSAIDWPRQPMSLAVLDFRYPTEREESHESGTTGGGSGTAVADLVFSRLDHGDFTLSRGDRQKLYRADFAGAARIGRQMGVDAVLAGTFVPIEGPPTPDGFPGPRTWELRAGVVDTCTGQLLMRLYSQTCVNGVLPGQEANEAQCRRLTVTAKQAMNPETNASAFGAPLDALLFPLEHNRTPADEPGALGTVTEMSGGSVMLKLSADSAVRAGDELDVRATRLTKNPVTYTLQSLHDQEIGRVSIVSVQGPVAVGSFSGEIPPRAGDVVLRISP